MCRPPGSGGRHQKVSTYPLRPAIPSSSSAVATDDAQHLAVLDLEGDILERPDGVGIAGCGGRNSQRLRTIRNRIPQCLVVLLFAANAVFFTKVLDTDSNTSPGAPLCLSHGGQCSMIQSILDPESPRFPQPVQLRPE